jgi:hypothetical protein
MVMFKIPPLTCSQSSHCYWVAVDDKILGVILKVFLETLLL